MKDSRMSAYCMTCLVKKQMEGLKDDLPEAVKAEYMRSVLRIICDSDVSETTPVVLDRINQLHQQYFGEPYSFEEIKVRYNELMLREEPDLRNQIRQSEDAVKTAMCLARVGNYIDFGTMDNVDPGKLRELLGQAETDILDPEEYAHFCQDMDSAGSLVYLTDNCGEVVLDKLLMETIRLRWPKVSVTVIVRGKPVINDATRMDAHMVGLDTVAEVFDNGNGIAGTWLPTMEKRARSRLQTADVVISKGQANFESLNGCGLNIYYLFLCKCEWFVQRFHMEKFKGVLVNDRRLRLER